MGVALSSRHAAPSSTPRVSTVQEKTGFVDDLRAALPSVMSGGALSADGSLSPANVAAWESAAELNPKLGLARTILSHADIREALLSRSAAIADQLIFNNVVDFKPAPVTSQKNSGRCWLFASTNVLRYGVMKKLKLDNFQLSQSYLFFWDKLNKANYFLELMIEHADLQEDDRLITFLCGDIVSDGGQWDMVVNLLETYGLVPQAVYPESTHSSFSSPLNALLQTKLREDALILRRIASALSASGTSRQVAIATMRAKKESLMKEIYVIMTATLGVPPDPNSPFVWEYQDADGKAGRWEGTPKQYYEQFGKLTYMPSDSFCVINDPRNPYSKLYTVDKLGNVWGGRKILYVNTEIENMKLMVVKLIKAGQPVFFGCDVGKFSNSSLGIMDTELYAYESAFDIKLGLTKADRLKFNESSMTHAMVISGVHLDEFGKPVRYKVENSWGPDVGKGGYFVMTDAWFEQFVYQIVVPKALAPKELVKVYESGDMTVLPPWDPMGTLA